MASSRPLVEQGTKLGCESVPRPAGAALWRAVFRPERLDAPPPGLAQAAGRFAVLTSPALAAFLLEPAAARLGVRLIEPRLAEASRLEARFTRAAQLKCLSALAEAGLAGVCLKGFANAHLLYPDPDLRLFGDLDLLVRPGELDRVAALLSARGFRFRPGAGRPWGFQAEGSFVPFLSPDGACNLDLHIEPDSYPLTRALGAARVFAQARALEAGGSRLLVPSPEHGLVIALSNAAKDRLGPFALRKLIDTARLLGSGATFDWDEVLGLLARARLIGPARAALALLVRLGAPLPALPPALTRPLAWLRMTEFERLVAEHETLFAVEPGPIAAIRREFLLAASPLVALRLNARRLFGLLRPRSGLPPGWASPGARLH